METELLIGFVVMVCEKGLGKRARENIMSQPPRVLRVVVLVLTMTPNLHTGSPPIFEDGRLKPGIYKIQNLYSRTYLDIQEHSRQMCCRPAQNIEEGNGLVRPFSRSVVRRSDNHKWKIMPLGAGYSVQRVRVNVNRHNLPLCAERRKA